MHDSVPLFWSLFLFNIFFEDTSCISFSSPSFLIGKKSHNRVLGRSVDPLEDQVLCSKFFHIFRRIRKICSSNSFDKGHHTRKRIGIPLEKEYDLIGAPKNGLPFFFSEINLLSIRWGWIWLRSILYCFLFLVLLLFFHVHILAHLFICESSSAAPKWS